MNDKADKKVSRRDFLKGATVAGISLLGPGIPFITKRASAKDDVVKYGTMHPLTGPYSALGADQVRATQLAVEEWNAKGGILGRKIEWVHETTSLTGPWLCGGPRSLWRRRSAISSGEPSPAPFLSP